MTPTDWACVLVGAFLAMLDEAFTALGAITKRVWGRLTRRRK